MEELVTIIIPVYKSEEYLDKCISSVLNQTYKSLEIILVDDGSPDDSGKMCDEYARKDKRISVIHKTNGGLSSARNAALNIMKGDYVFFLDSDDYLDLHTIEYLMDDMKKYDADIAECRIYSVYSGKLGTAHWLKETSVFSAEEAIIMNLGRNEGSAIFCPGKLSKRYIFQNLRFKEGHLYEDIFAIIDTLSQAKRIVIDIRPMYYYVRHKNTITISEFSERTMDIIVASEENMKKVSEKFPVAAWAAEYRVYRAHCLLIDRILTSSNWKKNTHYREELEYFRTNLVAICKNENINIRGKIRSLLFAFVPRIYRCMLIVRWKKNGLV